MGIIYKNGVQYGGTVDAANMHVDIGSSTLNLQTAIQNITGRVAPIESNPTTHAYEIGDLLVFNGMLYEATAAISSGDTLVIGTNIASTTVDDNKIGYNDICNNVITNDTTKVASAAVAKLLNDAINTLNSKQFASSRTAIATGSHNFTTIKDTNCTFTLSSPRMIEVYNDYNSSMPLYVAIAIKNNNNVYTIISAASVESTTGVTIGRLSTQAYLQAGTYTVLAKSNGSNSNTIGVYGY